MTEAECDRLLAKGGWEVADPRDYLRDQPGLFEFPPRFVDAVRVGSSVKAVLRVLDLADFARDRIEPYGPGGHPNFTRGYERMWFWVEKLEGSSLSAVLMNEPYTVFTRLRPGARLTLRCEELIEVNVSPPVSMADELAAMAACGWPRLAPSAALQLLTRTDPPQIAPEQTEICRRFGVKPQRPFPLSSLLLSEGISPETQFLYGVRARPRPDRNDCGWRIWTGDPDLETAGRIHRFTINHAHHVYERSPRAGHYLALPPGWGFVLGPNGYEDVYEEPAAL